MVKNIEKKSYFIKFSFLATGQSMSNSAIREIAVNYFLKKVLFNEIHFFLVTSRT